MEEKEASVAKPVFSPPKLEDIQTEVIDGRTYTYSVSERCRVCRAPADIAQLVDKLLVVGTTVAEVNRIVGPLQDQMHIKDLDKINYQSILNHRKNHLPFHQQAQREILERNAQKRGLSVLEGKQRILTTEAVYETIVNQVYEDMSVGSTRPTIDHALKALDAMEKMRQVGGGNERVEKVLSQFYTLIEIVKKNASPELWQKITSEIQRVQQLEEGTIDAEVVEDD